MSSLPDFLQSGGEMGALMRAHDWSRSSLGEPLSWPQPLRTVVRLMLNTGHPMYIWWGAELACLYNDAYRESIGPERHPQSLGRPAREVWSEIWPIIGPQIEQVMSGGGPTWHVDQLVPITRHGRLDDVYWTYSFSPIDDEAAPGGIGGVLVVCTETTARVVAARQLAIERDQLAQLFAQSPIFMVLLEGPAHVIRIANPAYHELVGDRPLVGRPLAEALPETVAQGYVALLDMVLASGEAYRASGARIALQPTDGGPPVERFVDFVYQPIRDADDLVRGIFVTGADVTERMRAFQSMRATEERLREAMKAGRMGYWETDHVARTRTWSPEAMALFGLDLVDGKGQLGGANDEFAAALHPDDRHLTRRFGALARAQDSFAAEYRIVRPDGTTLWLSGRGAVVARDDDGKPLRLVNVAADVTETRQAEQMLRTERERLRLALGAGRMGAFELDLVGDRLWWSPETYALFGVDPSSFAPTQMNVVDFIHPDDRTAAIARRREAIAQKRPFLDELRIVRADGEQLWVDFRGEAEYDAQGRPVRTFGVVMDITERKRAEEILRTSQREKDAFIATLSHELRNPLAPIQNAVTALRRLPADDPKVAWCHDLIARQTAQMARLLDDLLDVSRLTRGHLKLRTERIALATAVEQAVELAEPVIEAAGHTLHVELPQRPVLLDGDLTRLAQVFSNVLINAAKYTPSRGRIALTATEDGDAVSVKVTDTGIGIAEQNLGNIFEMFSQVDTARERSQGGQGIGLSLARALVELHGGTIGAKSEGIGKGSEFEIRLPLAPDQRAAA